MKEIGLSIHIEQNSYESHLISVPELDGKILLNSTTGQLHMRGAASRLSLPILVVRHGETDGNLRHVLQGRVDGPENQLNAKGRRQAKAAAQRVFAELEDIFGREILAALGKTARLVVLSSPIRRAKETAQRFVQHFNANCSLQLELRIEDRLKEISFGKYDGYALEDIPDDDFAAAVRRYRSMQDASIDWFGAGESFLDVVVRAKKLIDDLNGQFHDHIVVAFTHGTFISAMRTALGDVTILDDAGRVAFRDHIIGPAEAHWLVINRAVQHSENQTG